MNIDLATSKPEPQRCQIRREPEQVPSGRNHSENFIPVPAHHACLQLFNEEMRNRDGSMALTLQVLAEYSHAITDSQRFEHPLQMDEALELCEQWWHAPECYQVSATSEAAAVFLGCMTEYRLGRKQLLDTLLAASASYYCSGVTRWQQQLSRFQSIWRFEVLSMD